MPQVHTYIYIYICNYGGFLSHGVPPNHLFENFECSMKQTIQLLGYPHDYGKPHREVSWSFLISKMGDPQVTIDLNILNGVMTWIIWMYPRFMKFPYTCEYELWNFRTFSDWIWIEYICRNGSTCPMSRDVFYIGLSLVFVFRMFFDGEWSTISCAVNSKATFSHPKGVLVPSPFWGHDKPYIYIYIQCKPDIDNA